MDTTPKECPWPLPASNPQGDKIRRMRGLLIAVVLVAAGCLDPVEQPVTQERGAIGEPSNGFPSAAERTRPDGDQPRALRSRDGGGPQLEELSGATPGHLVTGVNQSSRFHATNLELADVTLMHTSPCTLNTDVGTSGCSGDRAAPARRPSPRVVRCARWSTR